MDAEYTDFYALLRQLGLRATHTSFYYTAYGMNLVLEAPERAEKIRELYADIAARYKQPVELVRDDIKTGILMIWRRNRPLLEELAGETLVRRPTPPRFFSILSGAFRKEAPDPAVAPEQAVSADTEPSPEQAVSPD